ncbi:MAG: glycerol kinase, partial [Actinobacteria bacterium]|nr:glycerol kinase [Actinomycetota bacterium]
ALVAAYAAGLAVGYWSGQDEIQSNWTADRQWDPAMDPEWREHRYAQWRKAVTRTFDWVDD